MGVDRKADCLCITVDGDCISSGRLSSGIQENVYL